MNRYVILILLCVAGSGGGAFAADLDVMAPTPVQDSVPSGPRWNGFTVGINGGGLWAPGQSETQIWFPPSLVTTGIPGSYSFSSRGLMVGGQAGFNKQWGSFVIGAVADYDLVGGAKTTQTASGAYTGEPPATPFTTTQSQQLQSLGTIRGRVGFTPIDDMLLYATAGLAFGQTRTSTSLTFDSGAAYAGARSDTAVGWAAGGGVEYALGPQWSIGGEFLYYDLGETHDVGIANFIYSNGDATPKSDSTFAFKGYALRLALNYEFDGSSDASAVAAAPDSSADIVGTFGVRAGMSTSSAQMKLYDFTGATKVSQLTYHNPTADTAEIYGRLDETSSGLFAKGFAAIGKEMRGYLQDEDFPPDTSPYSSTNSPQSDGHLSYADIDVGYYAMQGSWYKLGGFAGYHYLNQTFNAFGCTQTAGNADICPPGDVASSNLTITDVGVWRSVRLGIAGEMTLPAGFSLRAEAAWLPYIGFNGSNDHWLREPEDFSGAIPETGSGSNGYQLEAELNYALSHNFDIGIGGRFWSMNAKGHVLFQDVTPGGGAQVATFRTQLAQVFVQSAYHF
ncbi:outer membrane beta-barrel protein [Methylocapsa sp. S129]|uniref:outer membrane beta-barrel protein n=1 Tax=Methylocapsa sp. S129 TaxID=1641869 RepID=UPI00131DE6CF|nr:outer membrane beta-barrel protein [Methylocapsa sp. S129]